MGRVNYSTNHVLLSVAQKPLHRYTSRTLDESTVLSLLPSGGKRGKRENFSINKELNTRTGVSLVILIILVVSPGGAEEEQNTPPVAVTVTAEGGVYSLGDFTGPLVRGKTYQFTYPAGHPFRFSITSDGTHGGGVERKHGITISGNVLTFKVPQTVPDTIYYYCTIHSGMGSSLTVGYDTHTGCANWLHNKMDR